jgi:hypothetical protein
MRTLREISIGALADSRLRPEGVMAQADHQTTVAQPSPRAETGATKYEDRLHSIRRHSGHCFPIQVNGRIFSLRFKHPPLH